ncbi:MAG: prepilin-type N-terminal cleavage/methylation domain-containing protein [bacterium]
MKRCPGFSLIELLIVIAVFSVLTGIVILMLQGGFESYSFCHEELLLQRHLDNCLKYVINGEYSRYGLQDALEIVEAKNDKIAIVPTWIDDSHYIKTFESKKKIVTLNRPVKKSGGIPVVKLKKVRDESDHKKFIQEEEFELFPATFIPGEGKNPLILDDKIQLDGHLPDDSQLQIYFYPDSTQYPDTILTLGYDTSKKLLFRTYKSKPITIPPHLPKDIKISAFNLHYFDNKNQELVFDQGKSIPRESISCISAIKVSLTMEFKGREKELSSFIYLKNICLGN